MKKNWNSTTILIVDDDFTSVILFEEYLSFTQAKTFSAANSTDALNILSSQHIDIILMDLQLEDTSGLDLLQVIRDIYPDIPVIAETAYASLDDRRMCFEAGFNGYISKPISMDVLINEIDKFIKN